MADRILQGTEVLVVEDEPIVGKRLVRFLEAGGAEVTRAANYSEALHCLDALQFEYALVDINLPDGNGLELLRDGRFSPNTHVLIMTSEEGVETAVEAMKLGAADYLAKPFNPEELPLVFHRCSAARRATRREEYRAEASSSDPDLFFGPRMEALTRQMERILETDRRLHSGLPPVLIEGETGTGKTTIARHLHQRGPRAGQPVIEINCSTLPESLAESELFGHERGAFTDAKSARIGLFEAADKGTLFLDEVSSLSPGIQAKLLVAIEDGKIRRVGGNREVAVDIRIIAASNQPLKEAVAKGSFREDLYHRLDLLRLHLPPLRERREDLPELAAFLGNQVAQRYRCPPPPLSQEGRKRLLAYPWPGNIRELSHEIERQIILQPGEPLHFDSLRGLIEAEAETPSDPEDWLNPAWSFPENGLDWEGIESRFIRLALDQTDGNVSAAARLLGVTRDFIRYRLQAKDQ